MSWMSHQGNNDDQCKSNTKLVTSIAWGVPAAASRTPEYERTAHEAGISDALFEDEKGLVSIIEKLSTQGARRVYLEQAQPVIWRNYSPLSVARQFIDLLSGRVGQ